MSVLPRHLAAMLLPALFAAAAAHASGFALKEQSATYQGASFAGATARADDPATLFFNPAGITRLAGYQISLSTAAIMPTAQMTSGSATRNAFLGGTAINGSLTSDAAVNAIIGSVYATGHVSQDVAIGLSITAPYGLATKYGTNSIARYQALTSVLRTTDIAPAIAWQVLPTLSIGAAIHAEYAEATLSNAADFGAFLGLPGAADGIGTIKGHDTAYAWQIGLLWEPMPGTRIGADYHSAAFHKLQGNITYSGVPAPLRPLFVSGTAATAKLVTPDLFSVGVAQDFGRWTLLADASLTRWSHFNQLTAYYGTSRSLTQESWRDTFGMSAGADYRITDEVTLRGGLAYDQSPVPNSTRTPRVPDNDRFWMSVGASWAPTPRLSLSAAYTHIFVADGTVALADTGGPTSPSFGRGNLNAAYSNSIDIVSLQATLKF
jgi:long-chain fatty acid transport protein